jgi:phospho-2-dehydro-3-deoxyheptonate aldolase
MKSKMLYRTDDLRIKEIKELLPPEVIRREFPLTERASEVAHATRNEIHRILHGADDRLLVVIGPCSIMTEGRTGIRRYTEGRERAASRGPPDCHARLF